MKTTPKQIAENNFATAIDQQGDFENLKAALDSYIQNASDTATENGLDAMETQSYFCKLVADQFPELEF